MLSQSSSLLYNWSITVNHFSFHLNTASIKVCEITKGVGNASTKTSSYRKKRHICYLPPTVCWDSKMTNYKSRGLVLHYPSDRKKMRELSEGGGVSLFTSTQRNQTFHSMRTSSFQDWKKKKTGDSSGARLNLKPRRLRTLPTDFLRGQSSTIRIIASSKKKRGRNSRTYAVKTLILYRLT